MIDSCSPSKLEPGLAATYSMPRFRSTSTIRSEPGRTTAGPVTAGGCTAPASRSICACVGGGAPPAAAAPPPACGSSVVVAVAGTVAVNAAVPAAAVAVAAPFRNPRRLTRVPFETAMCVVLCNDHRPPEGGLYDGSALAAAHEVAGLAA